MAWICSGITYECVHGNAFVPAVVRDRRGHRIGDASVGEHRHPSEDRAGYKNPLTRFRHVFPTRHGFLFRHRVRVSCKTVNHPWERG